MDDIIDKPCEVDRAREAVLEYLLLLLDQELWITSHQNVHEMIAIISAWYLLWDWESRKLVHEKSTQNVYQIPRGILALTADFVIASSPKASVKRGAGFSLQWIF